jgi:hypothetical protein
MNVVIIERIRADGVVDVYDATSDVHKTGHLAVRPGGMLVFQEFQAVSLPSQRQETPMEREQRTTREREMAVLQGREHAGKVSLREMTDMGGTAPGTILPGEDAKPVAPTHMPERAVQDAQPGPTDAEPAETVEQRAEAARAKARGKGPKPKEPAAT